MYQKISHRIVSLLIVLALSFSGSTPALTAQLVADSASDCQSATGATYPCNAALETRMAAEQLNSSAVQLRRVAIFDDQGTNFFAQQLAEVLNTDSEVAASVLTRDNVETGALAGFSCIVTRLPGFGDQPTASTIQAIQEFVAGGGGYIGEWWGAGAALSGAGPSVNGDFGTPARFLSLFSGLVSDGSSVQYDNPLTIIQDHPVVQGLPGTFSGGNGTEYFVRAPAPIDPALTVISTFEGHGGTNPAIMVGQSGVSNTVLLFFDAIDDPNNVYLSQLWLNSVKFACPIQDVPPPANDDFSAAISVASYPFSDNVDTLSASREVDEPTSSCESEPFSNTVWYDFTPTETGVISASINAFLSSGVTAYTGNSLTGLTEVGCRSNGELLTFNADANTTYHFQVSGLSGSNGLLQFNLTQLFPPANDNFATPEVIGSLPFTATVDITDAMTEPGEPGSCTPMERTVWYSFTPAENMVVQMDMLGSAISGNVNTYIPSGPGISDLSFLGCTAYTGSFAFNAEAGKTYHLQAGSDYGGVGNIRINLKQIFPPTNDMFSNAEVIASLPFTATLDITDAMTEPGEPQSCYFMERTAWYSFTPGENMVVQADIQGSTVNGNVNIYHATGSGIADLQHLTCSGPFESSRFIAEAGETYYLQAGSISTGSGTIQLNLEQIPSPANDDFASATPIDSFPSTTDFTNIGATMESGEPTPSCAYTSPPFSTIWFSFTPTQDETILANLPNNSFNPFWAVYSGTSLNNLTELGCRNYGTLFWHATAGETYYIQIGGLFAESGSGILSLETTSPPQVNFSFNPSDPSKFDNIQFFDNSYDPSGIGIETWEWDFGDGTPHSANPNPTHIYRADGEYNVTLNVTTFDGRTGSYTQMITLGSHDVTITKVDSPDSGRVGRTQRITVTVSNIKASPETVTVDLYKSVPNGGFEYVASLTLTVPASTRGRVTKFTFQYTFTSADAQIGKMIFRAIANIDGLRDSFPQDNERLSLITTLRRPISYP